MDRRTLIAAVLLAALALPAGAGAGGSGGLFLRGRFSGSDAAVAAGAFGGAALMFGAAGAADRGPAWRDEPPLLIVDATPPRSISTGGGSAPRANWSPSRCPCPRAPTRSE
jgi:hypothetical protein